MVAGNVLALFLGLARGVACVPGRFLLGGESFLAFGFSCGLKLGLGLFPGLLFDKASLLLELLRLAFGGARLPGFGCL